MGQTWYYKGVYCLMLPKLYKNCVYLMTSSWVDMLAYALVFFGMTKNLIEMRLWLGSLMNLRLGQALDRNQLCQLVNKVL